MLSTGLEVECQFSAAQAKGGPGGSVTTLGELSSFLAAGRTYGGELNAAMCL
jgi:hypothetical protein